MADELVKCQSVEEKLLLALIDRIDRVEDSIQQISKQLCPRPTGKNALDDLKPEDAGGVWFSEEKDAEFLADKLKYGSRRSNLDTMNCQLDATVNYPANVERLRKNGFGIRQLSGNHARIEWTSRKLTRS